MFIQQIKLIHYRTDLVFYTLIKYIIKYIFYIIEKNKKIFHNLIRLDPLRI